ncbi:MAG: ABC transporter permease [Acidobacteriota bacterium]
MSREPRVARWYRRALRLYPPALRAAHEDEMVEVVRRRWCAIEGASLPRRAVFVSRTAVEALTQGAAAWLERVGGRRRGGPTSRRRHFGCLLGELAQEVRLAGRALRRSPGFTAVAALTLALGIGANAAIFALVESVLLAPLPYPQSDRLAAVEQVWVPTEITLDLRASSSAFEEIAGYYPQRLIVNVAGEPLELEGAAVTPGFFDLFGAGMARGRAFASSDARSGAPPVAVLGYGAWQRLYGGTEDVLGRAIDIDGQPRTVVGVLERGFRLQTVRTDDPQLWIPLELRPTDPDGAFNWEIPVGRLAPGATVRRAQAELDSVTGRFLREHPEESGSTRWDLRLATLKETLVGDARRPLLVLQAAVAVLLLLACANVANLLLVRSGGRRQELAVRAALGASSGRLVRLLLGESLLLSLLAGALGLLFTYASRGILLALAPSTMPRVAQATVDVPVIAFTALVCMVIAFAFGVAPGVLATRRGLNEALEGSGRGATGSPARHRLSRGLAIAEVCLTLVLLVAAGLLGRSFLSLSRQDPGFRTADIVALSLRLSEREYDRMEKLDDFLRRARAGIAQIPGVEAATVSNYLPLAMGATREYLVEGAGASEVATAQYGVVSPDYFRVLDIPLLQGRAFDDGDRRDAPPVAIVDEAMARAAWPGENPLGRRFRMSEEEPWLTVVGLVGAIRGRGLGQPPRPGFYVPDQQRPADPVELAVGRNAVLLVRSSIGPERLAGSLRAALRGVDPLQPVPDLIVLNDALAAQLGPQRFRAQLLGAFALVALLTAVAGIYGVVAYLVSEKTRELGIRRVLGATRRDIVAHVLGWGLRLAAVGVVLGLAVAVAVTRYLASLLFEVSPVDAPTIAVAAGVVALVTLAACVPPAWRAITLDPALPLRGITKRGRGR